MDESEKKNDLKQGSIKDFLEKTFQSVYIILGISLLSLAYVYEFGYFLYFKIPMEYLQMSGAKIFNNIFIGLLYFIPVLTALMLVNHKFFAGLLSISNTPSWLKRLLMGSIIFVVLLISFWELPFDLLDIMFKKYFNDNSTMKQIFSILLSPESIIIGIFLIYVYTFISPIYRVKTSDGYLKKINKDAEEPKYIFEVIGNKFGSYILMILILILMFTYVCVKGYEDAKNQEEFDFINLNKENTLIVLTRYNEFLVVAPFKKGTVIPSYRAIQADKDTKIERRKVGKYMQGKFYGLEVNDNLAHISQEEKNKK
ncbi:hypothetical protein [Aneurinibacillus sp. UBA3580]|jgi:hypothetical protein|uniref:hypothetical protein n=1 Tax=Aneurinibacillus sp. UBA3580 TaxID=1946041 RepID=UPI00257CDB80|nr:hypothetical protein [Aneurinibacillus sp. UBA3580]